MLSKIKQLIYLIEGNIKSDSRFDNNYRKKIRYLYGYNKPIFQQNIIKTIPVPIIDNSKLDLLEKENKKLKEIITSFNSTNNLENIKNTNDDFLKKVLNDLNDINNKIKNIISE